MRAHLFPEMYMIPSDIFFFYSLAGPGDKGCLYHAMAYISCDKFKLNYFGLETTKT